MNILIAIDSFKGSLTSIELADAIEGGIYEVSTEFIIKKVPIADGGEGTVETLVKGIGGKIIEIAVKDPLFNKIITEYGILKDNTAVIEMATASGLTLVPENLRNPMNTTTYGVGQMINNAITKGCRNFIIGIGGSATNDGGIGMLNALGYKFLDKSEDELIPIGSSLEKIVKIDSSAVTATLNRCNFLIACDVNNPFAGANGAAHVYAKQKGASEKEVEHLDEGLKNFARVIKDDLGINLAKTEGSGAAGGLGGGFKAFLNAALKPGIEIIFDLINLEEKIKWADVIITGEGRLDFQTIMGKAPIGVAKLAKNHGKIVIGLAGNVTDEAVKSHDMGITALFSIMDSPMTLEHAMDNKTTKKLIKKSVVEIFRLIQMMK